MESIKILVTDDSEINLEIQSSLISNRFGFTCDTALSGADAISLCKAKKYDIIFTDYLMPKMDGLQTAVEIRKIKLNENTPIIALTGNDDDETRALFEEAGMNGFLTKPVDESSLFEVFNKYLENVTMSDLRKEEAYADAFVQQVLAVPGIDVESGLKNVAGDRTAFQKSLRLLNDRVISIRVELKEALIYNDVATLKNDFHKMKGTFAYIGFKEAADQSAALEKSISAGDLTYVKENLGSYIDVLDKIKNSLEVLFPPREIEDDTAISFDDNTNDADIAEITTRLRELTEDFDFNGIKKYLEKIKQKEQSKAVTRLLDKVQSKLDLFDYDAVLKILTDN
ncbi:MAG: response regulator [Ruminococcus sp.]|jgi:CheY-like chemotaxis protein|nr:response regulator [Ruminococcus sp.]